VYKECSDNIPEKRSCLPAHSEVVEVICEAIEREEAALNNALGTKAAVTCKAARITKPNIDNL
jgi:hypothetical protein